MDKFYILNSELVLEGFQKLGRRTSGESRGAYVEYVSRANPEVQRPQFLKGEEYSAISALKKLIARNEEEEMHFLCSIEDFPSVGPAYWLTRQKELWRDFPDKKLIFWHDAGDMAGYALGALRMGVRHLVFTGPEKTFRKVRRIASYYQASVLPAAKALEITE